MQSTSKSIKTVAKEAKLRLKNKFWQGVKEEVNEKVERAKEEGICVSKVTGYYQSKISKNIYFDGKGEEEFYSKVKEILIKMGQPSNALDLLMDKEIFEKLSYYEREKYLLRLSEKYLLAIERFKNESVYEGIEQFN